MVGLRAAIIYLCRAQKVMLRIENHLEKKSLLFLVLWTDAVADQNIASVIHTFQQPLKRALCVCRPLNLGLDRYAVVEFSNHGASVEIKPKTPKQTIRGQAYFLFSFSVSDQSLLCFYTHFPDAPKVSPTLPLHLSRHSSPSSHMMEVVN